MSSLDNYEIIPAKVSDIRHRNECIPYYDAFYSDDADAWCLSTAYLPVIAAPMSSVINKENYLEFDAEGIMTVMPRTIPYQERVELLQNLLFVAFGLDEFEKFIKENESVPEETKICLDLANGHMQKVLDICKQAKEKFGDNLILMTGNIANPETYLEYAKAGIDYVRCSIGSGNVCSTSYLSGVHMSLDKLITKCAEYKKVVQNDKIGWGGNTYKSIPKIVADGGFQTIRQIIIALALGADYVMCGQIFAQCEEACGREMIQIEGKESKRYHLYYGMSTERAQAEMGNKRIKLAEGVEKWVPIEYTLHNWVQQFVAAISSSMSYCNARFLEDFIGKVRVEKASEGEYLSYEKSQFKFGKL